MTFDNWHLKRSFRVIVVATSAAPTKAACTDRGADGLNLWNADNLVNTTVLRRQVGQLRSKLQLHRFVRQ